MGNMLFSTLCENLTIQCKARLNEQKLRFDCFEIGVEGWENILWDS